MRLVIQGQQVLPEQLAELTRLASNPFRPLGDHAYSARVESSHTDITTWCESQQLDCAFVPDHLTLANIGLVVMDMDFHPDFHRVHRRNCRYGWPQTAGGRDYRERDAR